MISSFSFLCLFLARIEINEKKQEKARINAIIEANSSMALDVALLVTCNDVITKRQNPRRFADVGKIC